jgi:membrane protein implicated in regulation of membrane protease activity
MSIGQIVALIFAILLLLPGGCFLLFGIDDVNKSRQYTCVSGCGMPDYLTMLPVAVAILSVAGLLFWLAFRRRASSPGEVQQTPSDPEAGGGVS